MLTHPLRRVVAACASVLLVLGLIGWTSSPSQAADGDGVISGKVTDPTGAGVGSIRVTFFRQNGDIWEEVPLEETYSFFDRYHEAPLQVGKYSATLAPGTYKVAFNLPTIYETGPRRFSTEYFNEVPTLEAAETIVVTSGSSRTNVNAQLNDTGGTVSGTVRDVNGDPIAFAEVYGYHEEFSSEGLSVFERGTNIETYTDEAGRYSLRTFGEPIKIRFAEGGYLTELFDDTLIWADAAAFSPEPGVDVPNIDAVLLPGPHVNEALPQISGDLFAGGTARAYQGDWSSGNATFTYEWFREGTVNPIATGKTYKVSSYSIGKKLTVRVTAHQVGTPDVQATSLPSAKVKRASYLALYASSPAKITAKFTVTLRFTGVSYPSGKVRVSCGLWSKSISVYKGRGTGTLKPIPSGYRKCKAVYAGTSTVAGDTAYKNFTVK